MKAYFATKLIWHGLLAGIVSGLGVSGCAEVQFLSQVSKEISPNKSVDGGSDAGNGSHYKVGNAYRIKGKWYYPRVDYSYVETGVASWYGPNFHGKKTANGAIFNMHKVSAAHRTLPLPSMVLVTNLENGRALKIKVNDRGPYAHNRIIDVSKRAAELLGFKIQGTALVKVELLEAESRKLADLMQNGGIYVNQPPAPDAAPTVTVASESLSPPPGTDESLPASQNHVVAVAAPPPDAPGRDVRTQNLESDKKFHIVKLDKATPEIYIQAGAFSQYQNAARTEALLSAISPVRIEQINRADMPLFRVRVGPISSVSHADQLLLEINAAGYPDARIIVD